MAMKSYSGTHIRWAIRVEESGLCTPDFLNDESTEHGWYLTNEDFQAKVEQARHFIFDEIPQRFGSELYERLAYYLNQFFDEEEALKLFNRIITIYSQHIY